MSTLDSVREMEEQGVSESEIIQRLTEQGLSPFEIQQALEQSKIKSAVGSEYQDLQPSLMTQEQQEPYQEYSQEQPKSQVQEYPQYQQYPQYQEYQPASTETISEISEQIVEEKLNQIKKDLSKMSDFKNSSTKKIEDVESRLKRIESIIDKMQISILGKIGDYGSNLDAIKQEMGMMQESFSKALNPLIDRTREIKKHSNEKQEDNSSRQERKPKNKESFEDLLGR